MLDFAYGELALKPDEFWDLTWGEYFRMARGYNRRYDLEQFKTGHILAAIYNTIPRKKGAEPLTAQDFMPKKSKPLKQYTPEERKELARKALEKAQQFDIKGVKKII